MLSCTSMSYGAAEQREQVVRVLRVVRCHLLRRVAAGEHRRHRVRGPAADPGGVAVPGGAAGQRGEVRVALARRSSRPGRAARPAGTRRASASPPAGGRPDARCHAGAAGARPSGQHHGRGRRREDEQRHEDHRPDRGDPQQLARHPPAPGTRSRDAGADRPARAAASGSPRSGSSCLPTCTASAATSRPTVTGGRSARAARPGEPGQRPERPTARAAGPARQRDQQQDRPGAGAVEQEEVGALPGDVEQRLGDRQPRRLRAHDLQRPVRATRRPPASRRWDRAACVGRGGSGQPRRTPAYSVRVPPGSSPAARSSKRSPSSRSNASRW